MKINILVQLKKIYLLAFAITFLTPKSQTQHCPFDGTSIIIVKIEGNKEEITSIVLLEKKTKKSDTCRFAQGLIRIDWSTFFRARQRQTFIN